MKTRKWTRDLELKAKLLLKIHVLQPLKPKEILILLKTVLYFKLFWGAM